MSVAGNLDRFLLFSNFQMEEGREAEVLPTPATRGRGRGRGRRFGQRGSIVRATTWSEGRCKHSDRGPEHVIRL